MKRLLIAITLLASLHLLAEDYSDKELPLDEYDTPILYAPWRNNYIKKIEGPEITDDHCPFCSEMKSLNGVDNFILRRFKHTLVMLNLFPYVKGHLLVMPIEHTGHLKDLSPEARAEMIEVATASLEILNEMYGLAGANVGFNLGRIAGASIPDHLHMHIVPRSTIRTSFIQIIGRTEIANFDIRKVYQELKPEFDKIVLP